MRANLYFHLACMQQLILITGEGGEIESGRDEVGKKEEDGRGEIFFL